MAPQREWFEKDYYAVLGVQSGASDKEIQRAYRKLAKQYHPDANQGDAAAEERFKEISAAHEVLGDADKRKEYDEVREMVASGVGPGSFGGGFGGGGFPGGFQGQTINFEDIGGLGDLLGGLFGGGGGGRRGGRRRARSGGTAARRGSRGRALSRLPRRGARGHDVGEPHRGGAVLGVRRQRREAGHVPRDVRDLRRHRRGGRRPGSVLVLEGVPDLRWARPDRQGQVQALQGTWHRGPAARGEGAACRPV